MKNYTVVLLRPEYLGNDTETPYGKDIYVANVEAPDEYYAVSEAQLQAFHADKEDGLKPKAPSEYNLCVLFEGKHEPKLFGWQPH